MSVFIYLGCEVAVLSDEENNFQGLFFQDKHMLNDYKSYPEVLFVDATYKLTELRFPVYLFLVEDSNGSSEVAGVGVVANESGEIVEWLLNTFKTFNDTTNLRVVMADKDISERSLIKKCFPRVALLICLYHALRSFKREISGKAHNLKEGQQHVLKEVFQKNVLLD